MRFFIFDSVFIIIHKRNAIFHEGAKAKVIFYIFARWNTGINGNNDYWRKVRLLTVGLRIFGGCEAYLEGRIELPCCYILGYCQTE